MSFPRAFVSEFATALDIAVISTAIVAAASLPWLRVPVIPWPWLLFLGLSALSSTWSIDPEGTWDSVFLYATITAVALVIGANVDVGVLCWGFGVGGVVVVGTSVFAFHENMAWAWNATMDGGRRLTGVGGNVNILAYTVVIALAVSLATPLPRRLMGRIAWVAVIVGNCYGVYLAHSGTGYVGAASVLTAAALMWMAAPLSRRGRRELWAAAAGVLLLLAGVVYLVVDELGKQLSTFSDRSPFWVATIEASRDSLAFGSGWGAVWDHPWDRSPSNEALQSIYDKAGYRLVHGHNFFVDVLPELGLAGILASLVMIGYLGRIAYRTRAAETRTTSPSRLIVLVLVALLTVGITEPMFTAPIGWWTLAVVASLAAVVRRSAQPSPQHRAEGRRRRRARSESCSERDRPFTNMNGRPRAEVSRYSAGVGSNGRGRKPKSSRAAE
jgi:hypothetical protein